MLKMGQGAMAGVAAALILALAHLEVTQACIPLHVAQNQSATDPGYMSLIPLDITTRARSPGEGPTLVTLRYWSDGESPVIVVWTGTNQAGEQRQILSDESVTAGVHTTRVAFFQADRGTLYLENKDLEFKLLLLPQQAPANLEEEAEEEEEVVANQAAANPATCIPVPRLNVEPAGDIVYSEGKDVIVNVTIPALSANQFTSHQLYIRPKLIDPHTGEFNDPEVSYNQADFLGFFNYIGLTRDAIGEQIEVLLKTSEYNSSGFVAFKTASVSQNQESFIQAVFIGRNVALRPESQNGTFPADYLNFLMESSHNMHEEEDGAIEQKFCDRRYLTQECMVGCTAVSEGEVTVDLWKLNDKGERQAVTGPVGNAHPYSQYYHQAYTVVAPQPDPATFQCEAKDEQGAAISKTVQVNFFLSVMMDRLASHVHQVNDYTVQATCVATGHPTPTIAFWLTRVIGEEENYVDYAEVEPDSVVVKGDRVVATVTEPLKVSWARGSAAVLTFVECFATQVAQEGFTLDAAFDDVILEV